MIKRSLLCLLVAMLFADRTEAEEVLFEDEFESPLSEGWSWRREDPEGWRLRNGALEVRVQPGNMWGGANDARNVLVRSAPDPAEKPVEVSVVVENQPTEQYEQVDLVWYYDDSHMVKVGQELVDGQLSIVMGREEADRTRTIAIIPVDSHRIQLRFRAKEGHVQGDFRIPDEGEWKVAGKCDLPIHGEPKISLQTYQGPAAVEHWARFTKLRVATGQD